MIRKQLYIDPSQDAALKRKARELGVSEAELVRRALDNALSSPASKTKRISALQAVLKDAKALSKTHRVPENYRFNREDAYDDTRLERWNR